MTEEQRIELAKKAMRVKQEARRYVVSWNGGGPSQIYQGCAGFKELSQFIGLNQSSLGNYLSKGKGQFVREGTNPTTGETDIMTVTRHDPPAKPKRPRGRPPKTYDLERLGSEFLTEVVPRRKPRS